MIPTHSQLRRQLAVVIAEKEEQGHDIRGVEEKLIDLPDSYDAIYDFAAEVAALPLRADWTFVEPNEWAEIQAEMHPDRPIGVFRAISPEDAAPRIETAFLASVCGCVLGKPVEIATDLATLRNAGQAAGEWPLRDYVTTAMMDALPHRHPSWENTTRGNIHFVEPDDDMNYTILGMLLLEKHGLKLSKANIRDAWMHHLPMATTWGPERTMLVRAGVNFLSDNHREVMENDPSDWPNYLNPYDEFCGAQIRADAYGYACPGRPELAAELAWRDASWTHRRTGVYSTMWTAAAIAVAPVAQNALEIFEVANGFVPQNSRFHQAVSFALEAVRNSSDWMDGYEKLRAKYGEFGHCRVLFESGTMINSMHWAQDIGDGFCMQVMQGNDTDSYGATMGSLLGAYFGPEHLEDRWLEPFNDDIHTALCWFYERSLSKLAQRMGQLPAQIAAELQTGA